jgi:thiamine-phosphate pyrophosphorylase
MLIPLPTSPFLYPILDSGYSTNLLADAEAVIRAGIKIFQVRAKNETRRSIYEITREIAALCNERKVCCIVNDCVDIALVTLVSGVHLGQLDFSANEARGLLQEKIIGLSTHNPAQFLSANNEPVDYIAIGPVFQTRTKVNPDPALGLEVIAALVRQKKKPVVVIGGIVRDQFAQLIRLNVDGIAVISDLYRAGSVYENASRMMEEFQKHEKI